MDKFQAQYTIDYQSLNPDLTVTFPRLMYYVQETSIRHTESTSYPMQWYAKEKIGWLLTNWSIRVMSYPHLHDTITIKTYPIQFKGPAAERGFEVYAKDNTLLLAAYSHWIYVDLNHLRLLRPPKDMLDNYGKTFPSPTEKTMGFAHTTGENSPYQLKNQRMFEVTRRDTDTNYHVNNIKYIEWAFDHVPNEIYETYAPKEVKVTYKKECKASESVLSEIYVNKNNPLDFCVMFKKAEHPSVLLAEVFSLWG